VIVAEPEYWLRGPVAGAPCLLQPVATERRVGRQALPATVLGLLFHAAEHTTRHAGQPITTSKTVRAHTGHA
jgi:hypothetical protein